MKHVRLHILLLIVFIAISSEGVAQWSKLMDTGDSVVTDINFLKTDSTPVRGIILTARTDGISFSTSVYRTVDAGNTWQRQISPNIFGYSFAVSSAIKDDKTLWVGTGSGTSGFLYKSDDFGLTYYPLPFTEGPNGMAYSHHKNILLLSGDKGVYKSYDEGMNWSTILTTTGSYWYYGFAFLNDSLGMVACEVGIPMLPKLFTSDGGDTWKNPIVVDEAYQPLAIQNTSTYYIVSIKPNNLIRSTDYGATWDTLYNFGSAQTTGCIVGDLCNLFVQTNDDGVFTSSDGGNMWKKITGLTNPVETRFFFHNNTLYIADQPSDDNGRNGSLWKYTLPPNKPTMVVDDIVITLPCPTQDTSDIPISFAAVNQCDGDKVVLDTMFVTGSTDFTITHDSLGKEIVWDTLRVQYEPTDASEDTAFVHFRFKLKGNYFDTVMTIRGRGSSTKDSLSFLTTLTKPSVTWEETTELRVTPDKAAANKGLAEIRFDVTLDADVLEPLTNYTTGIAGASIVMSGATPVGKLSRYGFVITGTNMTLDPAVSILNLPLRPYVSDTTMTTIELSSFTLNGFDPDYERCTLSAKGDGTPFTLELMCGDSTLSRHLGGKPILTIVSLKPNPTKSDVTVTFDLAASGSVRAEVLDVLGNVVKAETLEAHQGETKYNISLPDAAEGVYHVRLRFAGETRTVKFVRE